MLLRFLFDTVAPAQVGQFLCHVSLHEKDKMRLTAMRFLADVMPVFCVDSDVVLMIYIVISEGLKFNSFIT